MTVDRAYLDSVRARLAAATAGPWRSFIEGRDHESGSDFIRTAGEDMELVGATRADQDFIANARQDIEILLDEVERLRAVAGDG